MIFKTDLEKAYDHVDWDFVDCMFHRLGFGDIWQGWIRKCISSTSLFVLVNGSPSKLFKAFSGIWHGDPSPVLFTILVEALSLLLLKAKKLGVIGGFEMGCCGKAVTHLQLAYGIILFSSSKR